MLTTVKQKKIIIFIIQLGYCVHLYNINYDPNRDKAIQFDFKMFPTLKEHFGKLETALAERSANIGCQGRGKKLLAKSTDEMETIANCQTKVKALKKKQLSD